MINKAILIGRLGRDPELRTSQNGKQFCNMAIATDSGFGDTKKTDWHNVTCFEKQAENCGKYLKKGSMVYVEGRISYETYEKDGQKRYMTRIIAHSVQFLTPKSETGGTPSNVTSNQGYAANGYAANGYAAAPTSNYNPEPRYDDNDIPF